ncbi:hypothetical protein [Micromonospora musae]|uniref:Uncharacterized protein n=1 Tax=Micromonospora musae TaxID=1894970 RepID=A0A3A9XNV1_9ACTN|nr:hypothetical protein [Micromonospora musae]RKN26990.1 hypothetical protein D7044_29675 [Micromonospora musae]
MVYRYEFDEDAFVDDPERGSESMLGAGPPPPAGPSPSRFPTPSLPRTTRMALPAPEPQPSWAEDPAPPTLAQAEPPEPPRAEQVREQVAPEPPAPVPVPRAGGGRLWQVVVGGAAVLVLLALCGLGAAALLADRTPTPDVTPSYQAGANPSADPTGEENLDSRDADQTPLTAKEVFAGKKLVLDDGRTTYDVLKTQSSGSCAVAATDEIADLLVRLGCDQVVRGTLRTPDGDHLVTTGLFNLTDRASAERARDRIRQLLDERQGRFRGMAAGEEAEAIATAPARVGWQVRGHYLAYAVVARSDGAAIKSGDEKVREVLYDMIELHLNQGVLQRRADGGTASQPTAGPSATTGTQDSVDESPSDDESGENDESSGN